MSAQLHVVTGAYGYSGRAIARRLLDAGQRVRTLTNSPRRRHDLGRPIEVTPLGFADPAGLTESLRGAAVLYNTYWVRFNHKTFTFAEAVANSRILFAAARAAGVGRIVHVSITNPSEESDLEYFRGKALVERALGETGIPHSILRPAVLFGGEDILINNIAWALRHVPIFGVFGDGKYRLQPIHVEDFAALAVAQGAATGNAIINAIGPETFTYRGLAESIAAIIGVRRRIVGVPPRLGYAVAALVGKYVGDVTITWPEVQGLMRELLWVNAPSAGATKLTDWARENAATLGLHYANELRRRNDRTSAYATSSSGPEARHTE